MAITKGEAVQVLGRSIQKVGEYLDDEKTPDKIDKDELIDLIKTTIMDAYSEFAD